MKNNQITTVEIRTYWWKVFRKSWNKTIKEMGISKTSFLVSIGFIFIFIWLYSFLSVVGIVPILPIFEEIIDNIRAAWWTSIFSMIVTAVIAIGFIFRTPAELEKEQEKDFIKILQERNNDILELREALSSKIVKSGLEIYPDYPDKRKISLRITNTDKNKVISNCRAELTKMYLLEDGKEPFDFTDGLDKTNLIFLWRNSERKISLDCLEYDFLQIAEEKETFFDILFEEPFSYKGFKEKGNYNRVLAIEVKFEGKLGDSFFESEFYQTEIRYEVRYAEGERMVEFYAKEPSFKM